MPNKPTGNGFFVLYYGVPGDSNWPIIRSLRPNFVIVTRSKDSNDPSNSSLPPDDVDPEDLQFEIVDGNRVPTGIRVFYYVETGYERLVNDSSWLAIVKSRVKRAIDLGFDGVFFDEIMGKASYYSNVTRDQMNAAYEKIVSPSDLKFKIFNPGESQVDSLLFDHADIVCVENKYFESPTATNESGQVVAIEDWRWLSVQGDPAASASSSLSESIGRLEFFRRNGGFWYYSTPRIDQASSHWFLTPQIEEFADFVKAGPSLS